MQRGSSHRFQPRSGPSAAIVFVKRKRHQDDDKITQVSLPGAPSLPYSSRRLVRPPHGRSRSALAQLACAHADETLIWASKSKGARHSFNYDLISSLDPTAQVSSVRRIPIVPKVEKLHGYHPTQKPLRFLRRALLASMEEGNLAFDPYTGSEITAVAKELNRAFIGVELEEEFEARRPSDSGDSAGQPFARDLRAALEQRLNSLHRPCGQGRVGSPNGRKGS